MQYTIYSIIYILLCIYQCYIKDEAMEMMCGGSQLDWRRKLLTYLVCVMFLADIIILFQENTFVLFGFLVEIVVLNLNYRLDVKKRIKYICTLFVITALVYFVVKLIMYSLTFSWELMLIMDSIEYIMLKIYKKSKGYDGNFSIFFMFCIPAVFLVMVFLITYILPVNNLLRLILLACVLLVNICLMILYNRVISSYDERLENEVLGKQNEYYKQQIETVIESDEKIRLLRHDMRNHIEIIGNMVRDGKYDKLDDYVVSLVGELESALNIRKFDTGNFEFDAILNGKLVEGEQKKIHMNCMVQVPEKINIVPFDMSIIIGNLFDNAIRAAEALPEEKREIDVVFCYKREALFMDIRNAYDGDLKVDDEQQFLTTKGDTNEHGLGLKNVMKTIEKYKGDVKINAEDGIFDVQVILYLGA